MHFNSKSLWFYGVMIGSVLLLFRVVTHYGEKLQAPPDINGRYVSTENLPGCPTRFAIDIQQSGIYLSGDLLLSDAAVPSSEDKPLLKGLWQIGQITMSGTTAIACGANGSLPVQIQGQLSAPTEINGQIILGNGAPIPPSPADAIAFTAQKQPAAPKP